MHNLGRFEWSIIRKHFFDNKVRKNHNSEDNSKNLCYNCRKLGYLKANCPYQVEEKNKKSSKKYEHKKLDRHDWKKRHWYFKIIQKKAHTKVTLSEIFHIQTQSKR